MLKNAIYNFKEIHTGTAGMQRYKSCDHNVASGEKTVLAPLGNCCKNLNLLYFLLNTGTCWPKGLILRNSGSRKE